MFQKIVTVLHIFLGKFVKKGLVIRRKERMTGCTIQSPPSKVGYKLNYSDDLMVLLKHFVQKRFSVLGPRFQVYGQKPKT